MSLAPKRLLPLVAALYVAEGLPYGVVNELVPVWLKVEGMSLTDLGLLNLVGLPWVLKALWAPAVDRFGTTRAWVMGALGTAALLTAILPFLPHGPALAVALVLVAFCSATQDVAIDGYVATEVPPTLLGRVNGVRVAAYRFAMLLAGGGTVALAAVLPWSALFVGVALLMGALAVAALAIPATPRPEEPVISWVKELLDWLRSKGTLPLFLFVVLYKLGDAAMSPMVKPFWLDVGLAVEEVGLISITLGTIFTVLGALVGGEVTTRLGLFRSLWLLGGAQALSNLVYAAIAAMPSRAGIYGAGIFESFTSGLGTAAFLAFLMKATEQKQAATRFALLTALMGLTRTLSGAASGFGAEHFGYSTWFGLTFLLAIPGLGMLPFLRDRAER